MRNIVKFTLFTGRLKVRYRLTQLIIFRREVIQVAEKVEVRRAVAVIKVRVGMSLWIRVVEVLMDITGRNILWYVMIMRMHVLVRGRLLRRLMLLLLLLLMLVVLLERCEIFTVLVHSSIWSVHFRVFISTRMLMMIVHVVIMRLRLGIKISRICAVISSIKLIRIILVVGILSGILIVINLILWKFDRTRVKIIRRNFVIRIGFNHIVMLVIVSIVFLSVKLCKLLRIIRHILLMELDFVFRKQRIVDLQWQIWGWRAVLRIESLKVAVLDVCWLTLDFKLVLILIASISTIADV